MALTITTEDQKYEIDAFSNIRSFFFALRTKDLKLATELSSLVDVNFEFNRGTVLHDILHTNSNRRRWPSLYGRSPVIQFLSEDVLKNLLDRCVDLNRVNLHGYTYLYYGIYNSDRDLVSELLSRGADLDIGKEGRRDIGRDHNLSEFEKATIGPLEAALVYEEYQIARLIWEEMLRRHSDPEMKPLYFLEEAHERIKTYELD